MTTIRPFQQNDFPNWLALWDGNNNGERDVDITTETWSRLMDADFPIHGLAAIHKGEMAGMVQYVLHPTTGTIANVCYMQDVYVDPKFRKKGIARQLVEEVAKIGKREKWSRMYWIAESNNEGAQALYKNIGVKLDFTLHVMLLG